MGRVTYNYKHKYLFECNLGYTGSEQFAPENRYGFFPAVAVGWVPSQEGWWKRAMPVVEDENPLLGRPGRQRQFRFALALLQQLFERQRRLHL